MCASLLQVAAGEQADVDALMQNKAMGKMLRLTRKVLASDPTICMYVYCGMYQVMFQGK